jgi:hypothetical protein
MKFKTFYNAILFFLLMLSSNRIWSQSSNSIIYDDKKAQKILSKQQKQQAKTAKKSKKEAFKAHLKNQSKAFRKSIKRNYRRQKKIQKEKGRG